MGRNEELDEAKRKSAIEQLRSSKVGILLRIIDDLAGMSLTVREIETILRTCGMNDDCAIRFGATMKAQKDKDPGGPDFALHP